jgi:hypothetical protein
MDLFICTDTFITLRAAPSHRSEMTNQILFGERFQVLESCSTWLKVKASFDGYTGWIDSLPGGYKVWREEPEGIITGGMLTCIREDGSRMTLMPGSELFGLREDLSAFSLGDEHFLTPATDLSMLAPHVSVEETALHFLNAPYLWGGRTPAGTDCSGLVQIVFKIHGTGLPRNAAKQAATGTTINFFTEAEPGDILFFSEDNDEITHTGILYDSVTIIHAYGRVRKDKVDHQGIWSEEKGAYTHRLRLIKRIN